MSQKIDVIFYDGVVSRPHHAQIRAIDHFSIQIIYDDGKKNHHYQYEDMILIGALGQIKPVIELPDDARIEFQQELPEWFNLGHKKTYHSIWKLERSPSLIIFSLCFVIAFAFAFIKWGIPIASHYIAYSLPEKTLYQIGGEAEKSIIMMTSDSTITQQRQNQLKKEYLNVIALDHPAKLIFRQGNHIGANALALPNNTIIVTDELVKLADNDNELLAVLAHEQAHIIQRHSLQQALSGLGVTVLYIAITGDSSDLMTSLPTAFVGANYSRDFESTADYYALEVMQKNHIPVIHFANFLQKLEASHQQDDEDIDSKGSSIWELLSSHPKTKDRIQAIKYFEVKHKDN